MTVRVICFAHGAAPRWSLHCAQCSDDRALGGRFGLAMIGAAVAAGMMRSALEGLLAAVAHRAPRAWAWASLPGIEVDNGGRGGEFVTGDNGYSYYWCEWLDSERCAERVAGTRSHP